MITEYYESQDAQLPNRFFSFLDEFIDTITINEENMSVEIVSVSGFSGQSTAGKLIGRNGMHVKAVADKLNDFWSNETNPTKVWEITIK